MQHFLSEKTFQEIASVKKEVAQYFASKPGRQLFSRSNSPLSNNKDGENEGQTNLSFLLQA
jgi:hypothetical protein